MNCIMYKNGELDGESLSENIIFWAKTLGRTNLSKTH